MKCRVCMTYRVVDDETLGPDPRAAGRIPDTLIDGGITWRRVGTERISFASNWPVEDIDALEAHFAGSAARADEQLCAFGARLLGGGLHPFAEDVSPCWLTLELTAGDQAGLLARLAFLLPLSPALCAASPFSEGRATGQASSLLGRIHPHACLADDRVVVSIGDVPFDPRRGIEICRAFLRALDEVSDVSPSGSDQLLREVIHRAEHTIVPKRYCRALGLGDRARSASEVWSHFGGPTTTPATHLLEEIPHGATREHLVAIYRRSFPRFS